MQKANQDLRMLAKGAGVPLWAIAEKLGYSEGTLIRNWRQELSREEKATIREIITNS